MKIKGLATNLFNNFEQKLFYLQFSRPEYEKVPSKGTVSRTNVAILKLRIKDKPGKLLPADSLGQEPAEIERSTTGLHIRGGHTEEMNEK